MSSPEATPPGPPEAESDPKEAVPAPSGTSGQLPGGPSYWSKNVRDRWFFGALVFSTLALAWLFSPFVYVLLFAVVLVVVTWPLYSKVLQLVGSERRGLAATLTTFSLALVVFGPLATLLWIFIAQAIAFIQDAMVFFGSGQLREWIDLVEGFKIPSAVQEQMDRFLGPDFDLVVEISKPLQSGAMKVLGTAGELLPRLVNQTVTAGIGAIIFLFTVVTLYMEGPKVLRVINNLSPMDDAYENNLFEVFREFATNMVLGSLATAAIQGLVAVIGYAIVGMPQLVFLGILTGVGSFVPIVGTAFVWIPVAIYLAATKSVTAALFVAAWTILFTGSVDNIVKPLFLRGSSNIHPLLIFLGVFGGIYWMKVPGALVGPVIVAFFLALYTIYVRDFLGEEEPPIDPGAGGFMKMIRSILAWVKERTGGPGDTAPDSPEEEGPAPVGPPAS